MPRSFAPTISVRAGPRPSSSAAPFCTSTSAKFGTPLSAIAPISNGTDPMSATAPPSTPSFLAASNVGAAAAHDQRDPDEVGRACSRRSDGAEEDRLDRRDLELRSVIPAAVHGQRLRAELRHDLDALDPAGESTSCFAVTGSSVSPRTPGPRPWPREALSTARRSAALREPFPRLVRAAANEQHRRSEQSGMDRRISRPARTRRRAPRRRR